MKRVALTKASEPLSKYASELDNEIVVVTGRGRAVAALVPLHNVDRETLSLSSPPEFLELIERSRAEIAAGRTLTAAQIRAELGHEDSQHDSKAAPRPRREAKRGRR